MRRPVLAITLVLLSHGCGGPTPSPSAAVETCRKQLPPRPPLPAPSASADRAARPPAPRSRLVANVDLSLAALAKELEAKIAPRLAEEKNRSIGVAGHLNYTADRGPISLAVNGDTLLVRTDVHARAEACRGNSCYASCQPVGRATAAVSLRLTPDYRFAPSHVSFAMMRGCEVKALGGIVTIDVTPTLEQAIEPALRRVEKEIDGKLPPLRPEAERLWSELGKKRSLPLGACLLTHATGLVEGPVQAQKATDTLQVRLGLVAYPEIRTRCDATPAPPPPPLPPLAQEPELAPEEDLVLALVGPVEPLLGGLDASPPFEVANSSVRVARSNGVPGPAPAVQVDLGLRGDLCGDVGVRATVGWSADTRTLHLVSAALVPGEKERVAAAGLDPNALETALATPSFAPPLQPEALKDLVPTIAQGLSDPSVTVTAKVSEVKPLDVIVQAEDLSARVLVRGAVDLKQR
jgi:hypothetical protein